MKLTLELTEDVIAALRTDLRISTEDMRSIVHIAGDGERLDYALRIVRARRALGMSNGFADACFDYVALKE